MNQIERDVVDFFIKIKTMLAEYEDKSEYPTIDGFHTWLDRKQLIVLKEINKKLKENKKNGSN